MFYRCFFTTYVSPCCVPQPQQIDVEALSVEIAILELKIRLRKTGDKLHHVQAVIPVDESEPSREIGGVPFLGKPKEVYVEIGGGSVQEVKCPAGVRVLVRDYDVDEFAKDLDRDEKGHPCREVVYNGNN